MSPSDRDPNSVDPARPQRQPAPTVTRRRLLRWGGTALTLGALGGLSANYLYNVEPSDLVLERTTVRLRRLPRGFAGLRIALLSDLHHSPEVSLAHITRAVAMTMEARPDLVVVTGDLITGDQRYLGPCVQALSRLKAPLGVFAVLGNHDHWAGPVEQSITIIGAGGLRLLRNGWVTLSAGNDRIALAGMDDIWAGNDLDLTLRDIPHDMCRILLAHEPDTVDEAATRGVDLQLSGHSHGGQVKIPGLGPLILPPYGQKYPEGLRSVAGTMSQVYTTRGVGVVRPAIRFNCPPEVSILELSGDPV